MGVRMRREGEAGRRRVTVLALAALLALSTAGANSCDYDTSGSGTGTDSLEDTIGTPSSPPAEPDEVAPPSGSDEVAPPEETDKTEPPPEDTGGGDCEPGYDPCVPPYPPDVDCADVDGPIAVSGDDAHGLDRDGDGVGCE
jgi:hypothetical protein